MKTQAAAHVLWNLNQVGHLLAVEEAHDKGASVGVEGGGQSVPPSVAELEHVSQINDVSAERVNCVSGQQNSDHARPGQAGINFKTGKTVDDKDPRDLHEGYRGTILSAFSPVGARRVRRRKFSLPLSRLRAGS